MFGKWIPALYSLLTVRSAMHMQRQAYFLGAVYAAPRKIKFPTELQKNRFFNFILEKSSLIKSCIFS